MGLLHKLTDRARRVAGKVVLAEASDERMVCAASHLAAQDIASPVLTGSESVIRKIAQDRSVSLDGIEIADPKSQNFKLEEYSQIFSELPRPLKPQIAGRMMRRPLMYGALKVRMGEAQAMIAGASVPTARVIEAGLMIIGPQKGIHTPSSYFLMQMPVDRDGSERSVIFADCAVNVAPDPNQLAEIAIATARSAERILCEPARVALLSFSSKGSARHEFVDRVTEALAIVKDTHADILIDGELQFDAAFDRRTADLKIKQPSAVAGNANVFIFPDLNAGNIGYKITQYLGGAKAIGPVLQGFDRPISDLSRGATADDIVNATIVLLATSL